MYGDLHRHFVHGVVASYLDYLMQRSDTKSGTSSDLTRALHAATAMYHFREHLSAETRDRVAKECGDYRLLGDIVNAFKHQKLRWSSSSLVSANQLYELHRSTMYCDELGEYFHSEKLVVADLGDSRRDLLDVLTNVLNYWEKLLVEIGIQKTARAWTFPLHDEPRRRKDCNLSRLDLQITPGLALEMEAQVLRYNYDTRAIEPFDLTTWNVRARIYAPPKEHLHLTLTHAPSGSTATRSIELSTEESKLLKGMNEVERNTFISTLDRARAAMLEMKQELEKLADQPPTTSE